MHKKCKKKLDREIEKGYNIEVSPYAIETYQKPDNKQKIFYSLTETGMALYEEHAERHSLWVKRDKAFIDQYSQNDIQTIQQFMTDFNLYLDKQIKELEDNEK